MSKLFFASLIACSLLFSACNSTGPSTTAEQKEKIVLHFELDTAGNILNHEAEEKLKALAIHVSKTADKIMITAYSEQTGSNEKNFEIAQQMARSAKDAMLKADVSRIFYNVGVDIKGYSNPINQDNPADLVNRRIEITYL